MQKRGTVGEAETGTAGTGDNGPFVLAFLVLEVGDLAHLWRFEPAGRRQEEGIEAGDDSMRRLKMPNSTAVRGLLKREVGRLFVCDFNCDGYENGKNEWLGENIKRCADYLLRKTPNASG